MADTSNGPSAAGKADISRKEMVRRAMQMVGDDAPLADLQKTIRDRFRVELSTNHISSARVEIRREGKGRPAAKKAAPAKKTSAAPAATAPGADNGGTFSLEDIETARELLGRLGADKTRALLDVLAK
jgi:hypothetical protein